MAPDYRRVDAVMSLVRHRFGQTCGHHLPHAGGAPAPKAARDGTPIAVPFRHIAPGRTSAQAPQNAVHRCPPVQQRPAAPTFNRRQHGIQQPPCRLAQILRLKVVFFESTALNQMPSHASTALPAGPRVTTPRRRCSWLDASCNPSPSCSRR